jgi:hypothetical protein
LLADGRNAFMHDMDIVLEKGPKGKVGK